MAEKLKEKQDDQPLPAAGQEETPSMEEILRSIRGVISGNEAESSEKDDDVLELTDIVEEETTENTDNKKEEVSTMEEKINEPTAENSPVPEEEANPANKENDPNTTGKSVETPEKSVLDDIDNALAENAEGDKAKEGENAADDMLETSKNDSTLDEAYSGAENKLLTDEVADKSKSSLKELVKNIPKQVVDSPSTRGGTTLEDLVIEAMKPFLADWLNKNLPTIVKQLVEKEIRKLVPREDDN